MILDDESMRGCLEESQDLHGAAMRLTRDLLGEVVELGLERRVRGGGGPRAIGRRMFLRGSAGAAGIVGGGALGASLLSGMTAAAADSDVQMLQTAASLENLAVAVYGRVLGLPAQTSGTSIPFVKSFVLTTMRQHSQHADAFNAAAQALGGVAQKGIDGTVNDALVTPAVAAVAGPADVVRLAIAVEETAAATYIRFGGAAGEARARQPFATVAPVEAQHAAVLRTIASLLAAGVPQAATVPIDTARLPATAGSAGFPDTFFKTSAARPPAEGAAGAG